MPAHSLAGTSDDDSLFDACSLLGSGALGCDDPFGEHLVAGAGFDVMATLGGLTSLHEHGVSDSHDERSLAEDAEQHLASLSSGQSARCTTALRKPYGAGGDSRAQQQPSTARRGSSGGSGATACDSDSNMAETTSCAIVNAAGAIRTPTEASLPATSSGSVMPAGYLNAYPPMPPPPPIDASTGMVWGIPVPRVVVAPGFAGPSYAHGMMGPPPPPVPSAMGPVGMFGAWPPMMMMPPMFMSGPPASMARHPSWPPPPACYTGPATGACAPGAPPAVPAVGAFGAQLQPWPAAVGAARGGAAAAAVAVEPDAAARAPMAQEGPVDTNAFLNLAVFTSPCVATGTCNDAMEGIEPSPCQVHTLVA